MENEFTVENIRRGLLRISETMVSKSDELNALDGQIGDGDMGVTLKRGMLAISDELAVLPDDIGAAFLKCAQAFTKTSGSTLGTLIATGLMSVAKATKGHTGVRWTEVSPLLGMAMDAMAARGKASLGDKTVIDVLNAAKIASQNLENPFEIVTNSHQAVEKTIKEFRNIPSRQGRARILADKSIGVDDPGMVAFQLMLESLLM